MFTNSYLNIDDNTISYKYKLEVYSNLYYLQPINIYNSSSEN